MWKATRITADAANKMQLNSGCLLKKFDIANPVKPADEDLISETTSDYTIAAVPQFQDFFAEVNNAPTDTMEGKQITGWNCSLSITLVSITEETLKLSLGASDGTAASGVRGRRLLKTEDFRTIYWAGDMVEEGKVFVVVMENTLSTGGLSFTSTNNGKGTIALTLTAHASTKDLDKVPMAFYILEKVDDEAEAGEEAAE